MGSVTSVMWFRRDLRLNDNKALFHAMQNMNESRLILVFQMNPQQFIEGSPNHEAFFSSVRYFKEAIDTKGHLQILYGDPIESFVKMKENVPDWDTIYFNEDTSGFGRQRDTEVIRFFIENGIDYYSFQDHYLHGYNQIKKDNGDFYKVFTPYYKRWNEGIKEPPLTTSLRWESIYSDILFSKDEEKYTQVGSAISYHSHLFGEITAYERLTTFIETHLSYYNESRDIPSIDGTSQLSHFLRTGELSIRTVWEKLQTSETSLGRTTFEKELCWREFYNMIYSYYPTQKEEPLQSKFNYIKWRNNREEFLAWQAGKTGFPIVDAAMRQLLETGWMHNRLRMIVASFLTKDLLIDWRWGEKYFQQMLVDYDPASNIGGWQWAASTGTDAVPYFRVFNPTTQSKKFDEEGVFIREYVPELANLPSSLIHQPELLTEEQEKEYHLTLGVDYPRPIANHKERRQLAISAYEASKEVANELKR